MGLRGLRLAAVVVLATVFTWPAPANAAPTRFIAHESDLTVRHRDTELPHALHSLITPRSGWRAFATSELLPIAPAPPPEIEMTVWNAGVPGVLNRRVRVVSGKIVDNVVTPPQPAAPVGGPVVLLTFDDGPDPRWTPQVLDILRDRGVKAVFCVVGVQVNQFPDLVRRTSAEGHGLCDHTENHDMALPTKPTDYAAAQIAATFNEITAITGRAPAFYRAPGGALSPFIVGEARRLGMRVLGWTVDSVDYRRPGAGQIQNRILGALHPGAVVLMHDGGGDRSQTVAQLPSLIDRIRGAGYTLVAP